MQDQSREPLNFLKVVRFLYRWKITFFIVVILSGGLAYLFASPLITTPLYRSATTFYPTSKGALSHQVLDPDGTHEEGYLEFGEEPRVESFLEILKSETLKGIMLRRFDLFEHYDIPPSAPNRYKRFSQTFNSNFEFSKTQFMAIEVSVLDKDPQKAARMANTIVQLADSIQGNLRRERAKDALKVVKDKYQDQKARAAEIADSLQALSKKGLVAFEEQSESLVETLGKARLQDQGKVVDVIKDKLDVVGKWGPVYHGLISQLNLVNERITKLYENYQRIKGDIEADLRETYVLDKAQPTSDDAKPNKPLIVAIALLGSFIITAIVLRIYERWHILKREITGQS